MLIDEQQEAMIASEITQIRKQLLAWFGHHKRDLPWRRNRDPYAVWISEIMLQQTRVTAAIPYYERFLGRFPNPAALAEAPEAELLAHWAGLGYYYRARNLQKAAREVVANGGFPNTLESIRELPGIGDYTAAAIASISFDLPHAVLDGNVFRVLSRLFNDSTNIAASSSRKHFAAFANAVLDRQRPGDFNQAMMELGATVCLPKRPQCLVCPVSEFCQGRAAGKQDQLPVKKVERKTVQEERTVFWIENEDHVLVWQRSQTARLMPGFWELPEIMQLPDVVGDQLLGLFRHGITIHNYVFQVSAAKAPRDLRECRWVALDELEALPTSTILRKAWKVVRKSRLKPTVALGMAASQ
jgi:A/G-specific adenine glycosylase